MLVKRMTLAELVEMVRVLAWPRTAQEMISAVESAVARRRFRNRRAIGTTATRRRRQNLRKDVPRVLRGMATMVTIQAMATMMNPVVATTAMISLVAVIEVAHRVEPAEA